jgi:hypothetical protein
MPSSSAHSTLSRASQYDRSGYQRQTFNDRISPGGIRDTRVIASIPIPALTRPLLAYGRYWFQDIWKKRHTSGFVLVVRADGTDANVPPNIPRAYTDWN